MRRPSGRRAPPVRARGGTLSPPRRGQSTASGTGRRAGARPAPRRRLQAPRAASFGPWPKPARGGGGSQGVPGLLPTASLASNLRRVRHRAVSTSQRSADGEAGSTSSPPHPPRRRRRASRRTSSGGPPGPRPCTGARRTRSRSAPRGSARPPRARSQWPRASSTRTTSGCVSRARRPARAVGVADDDGPALARRDLRAMVVPALQPLAEAEGALEPGRLAHVRVDEDRHARPRGSSGSPRMVG